MTTVYFIYNNIDYLFPLINALLERSNTLKIVGYSTEVHSKCIKLCNKLKPNIIVSDYISLPKLDSVFNFDFVSLEIKDKDKKSLSIVNHQLRTLASNTQLSHEMHIHNIKRDIYKELLHLKFSPNFIGTNYLVDCILCYFENPYSQLTYSTVLEYFEVIAEKYDLTPSAINWAIQNAIEDMYCQTTNKFRLEHYLTDEYIGCLTLINYFKFLY